MQVKVASSLPRTPILLILPAMVALLFLPITSVFAYQHDVRDDQGQLNTTYFTTRNVLSFWTAFPNASNGFDNDTAIDCLELYTSCSQQATGDTATWWPYPSPSPYWMCPFSHVAKQSTWSTAYAQYLTNANGSQSFSVMYQPRYLNAWYALPNGDFRTYDYSEVMGDGGGQGAISADATDFHFNPNNPDDSSCS